MDTYWMFRRTFLIFYSIFLRLKVYGGENVPTDGGLIVAANHLSLLDPPLVGASLKRRATYLAKRGLFSHPLLGKFVRTFSLPVDRDSPKPSTIKEAVKRLRAGELLVMFPEGTRRGGDRTDAKRGVALMASLGDVPVVPALIEGTDRALPPGAKLIRPARVTVTFGLPLVRGRSEDQQDYQHRISSTIMDEIKKLKNLKGFPSAD